jgi:hypothetical protein
MAAWIWLSAGSGGGGALAGGGAPITTPIDTSEVDSALADLEGILHALDILRFQNELDKPGLAYHALAVLAQLAVEKGWGGPAHHLARRRGRARLALLLQQGDRAC